MVWFNDRSKASQCLVEALLFCSAKNLSTICLLLMWKRCKIKGHFMTFSIIRRLDFNSIILSRSIWVFATDKVVSESAAAWPSVSSNKHSKWLRIKSFQLNSCIMGVELPVYLGTFNITCRSPCPHLSLETHHVRHRLSKCLTAHNAYFDFSHVKPACMFRGVMPLETVSKAYVLLRE